MVSRVSYGTGNRCVSGNDTFLFTARVIARFLIYFDRDGHQLATYTVIIRWTPTIRYPFIYRFRNAAWLWICVNDTLELVSIVSCVDCDLKKRFKDLETRSGTGIISADIVPKFLRGSQASRLAFPVRK